MRQQLLAVAGVIGLAGTVAGGSALAAGATGRHASAPSAAKTSAPSGYLFPGLARTGATGGSADAERTVGGGAAASTGPIPAYNFYRVRFAGAADAQIGGINYSGAYTGNITVQTGPKSSTTRIFTNSGRAGAKPVYFTFPYARAARTAQVAGINSMGDIVGNYENRLGVFHGFELGHLGVFRKLSIPGAGTAKDEGTEIAGISPGGIIVGSFVTASKSATGFIDNHGHITKYSEKFAGTGLGQGTSVEFDYDGVFGGLFVGSGGAGHGWYVKDGKLHAVNDPSAGPDTKGKGSQLIGIDKKGRLYGIVTPDKGQTGSFSVVGSSYAPIVDPHQVPGKYQGTVVLGVNSKGDICGFYVYDPETNQIRAFFARPRT